MNKDEDISRKREFFYDVRKRFNEEKSPLDFMFIMRTTTNGMPRYNKNGNFNNSFHITRSGINPSRLGKIIAEWSEILNKNNVKFNACSYESIVPREGDFVYLDPPYANTKGMYYGKINYDNLWEYIRKLNCNYVLSFDGISGECDNTFSVPKDIYFKHEYILSGNSSFKRTIGKSNDSIVYESIYLG